WIGTRKDFAELAHFHINAKHTFQKTALIRMVLRYGRTHFNLPINPFRVCSIIELEIIFKRDFGCGSRSRFRFVRKRNDLRHGYSSSSPQSWIPYAPALTTLSGSNAHLMRVGPSGMPIRSSTTCLSILRISSNGLPLISSVSMEADAWLIAQPLPVNFTSSTIPSRTFKSIRILSPHKGFESSYEISASGIVP